MKEAPVVVVGAGPAGLAAANALDELSIPNLVLEGGPTVATTWRRRHDELRLNTIRWLSGLPGPRMPRSMGRWVTRDDYINYLERFAAQRQLKIRFDVQVERLDRLPSGWLVATAKGSYVAPHVVVATGYDRVAWMPEWPGRSSFHKPVVHLAEARRVKDFAGLDVLLVGAGNSGVEIAGHLVDAGVRSLKVSIRTPPNVVPRELAGAPLHPLTVWLRFLSERLLDTNAQLLGWLAFGDLRRYGIAAPAIGPYKRLRLSGVTVSVDQGFVRHLKAGRLEVVAEIDSFADGVVVLSDGRRLSPDVVLAATGYRRGLEPLVGHLGVLGASGSPTIGADSESASAPGLWFAGYRPAIEGQLRQHRIDAGRIAHAIARSSRERHRGRT